MLVLPKIKRYSGLKKEMPDHSLQTSTIEPPSFCYILTGEDHDSLSITPSTTGSQQSKPDSYTKLSDITPEITKRCSCTGKVLYIHLNAEVSTGGQFNMSHCIRKPAKCLGENKGADQLRGNREADQHLCFRYTDSTIPLLLKHKISSL